MSGLFGFGSGGSSNGSSSGSGAGGLGGGGGSILPVGNGGTESVSGYRISEHAFLASNGVLFGTAVLAFILRLYIRIGIQRHVYADDGFIALGMVLLTVSIGAYYKYYKLGYAEEDLIDGNLVALLNPDLITNGLKVRKWLTAASIMLWTTINCAKLSFLFLFRRLVLRLPRAKIYWWTVLVYLTIVWAWGISSFIAPCPSMDNLIDAISCISGSRAQLAVKYVFAQLALDVFGDLLVLAIPIRLIWQVQVRWTQKMGLMSSLCLSVALVVVSVVRATGVLRKGFLDSLWIIFWFFTAAEISMILSCATAFRTFFVARQAHQHHQQQQQRQRGEHPPPGPKERLSGLFSRFAHAVGRLLDPSSFYSGTTATNATNATANTAVWPHNAFVPPRGGRNGGRWKRAAEEPEDGRGSPLMQDLPRPPRAMITGLGSFVWRYGRDSYVSGGSGTFLPTLDDSEKEVVDGSEEQQCRTPVSEEPPDPNITSWLKDGDDY